MVHYDNIRAALSGTGLALRGGFSVPHDESASATRAIVLIGNHGAALWPAFESGRREEPNPLDAWTKRVVDPIATRFGAYAAYPSDRPYHPFQKWAQRAEPVHASPLGILLHADWGLWHAYRAALLFDRPVDGLPVRVEAASPCASCVSKPCLATCPVSAFDGVRYDVTACGAHLLARNAPHCADLGCRARDACPVAPGMRYPDAQVRFHMAAFVRSRAAAS